MRGAVFLLLAIAVISIEANAISVVSDYLVNDTLELMSGASKIYSIRLQNPTQNDAGIKLDYDNNFMKVLDYKEVYILPPMTTGYRVEFNVTAPSKPGLYRVSYTVSEVEAGSSGGLPIRLKINKNFNLKAIKAPDESYTNYNYAPYAVIALALLLYFLGKKYITKGTKGKTKRFL